MPEPVNSLSDEEKALVEYWHKQIKSRKKQHDKLLSEIQKSRLYAEGKMHDDGKSGLVRTNLIYSTMATLIPYVYAKDPEIACTLTEAVTPDVYEVFRGFSKTAEIVLQQEFVERGRLKKRMKSAMRSAFTSKLGWLKVIYQRDYNQDPLLRFRMNDIQENIRRMDMLRRGVGDGDTDADRKKAELQAQLQSLQQRVEVPLSEGVVIDRVRAEDLIILDPSVVDWDEYELASAISHVVWMQPEQFDAAFGTDYSRASSAKDVDGGSPTVYQDRDVEKAGGVQNDESVSWYRVHEIWNRTSNTVYTVCDGYKRFCRPPFQPTRLGRRWYPFFGLAFFPVDGSPIPLSLVDLVKELVDEYNLTRTQYADHRADSLPVRVVRKGGSLSEEDVERIRNRRALDIIAVEGIPGQPISNDLGFIPNAELDPKVYDVTMIRNDIDLVSGVSDASRSNLIDPKTATEAEIMREGMMNRTNEMQDTNEDTITEMADYALQVLLLELTEAQVVKIAGPQAVWPRISKEEVYNMVRVKVRAGSTGKPNKQKDREAWVQLLPELKELVLTISQLMGQGMTPIADSLVEIAKETLLRFDEKLDIQKLLPFAKSNDPTGQNMGLQGMGPPMVPPEQAQQMQEVIQTTTQQVAQLEQALAQKEAEIQQYEAQLKAESDAAMAEAERAAEDAIRAEQEKCKQIVEEERARAAEAINAAKEAYDTTQEERKHTEDMAYLQQQAKLREVVTSKLLDLVTKGAEEGGEPRNVQEAADSLKASGALNEETTKIVDEVAAEIAKVMSFLKAKRKFVRDKSGKTVAVEIEGQGRVPVQTDDNGRIISVGGAPLTEKEEANGNARA